MDNEPLISVIVPVYQVEAYLDRCVESIVGQTYKNLQIILVDDGSPDNCPAMCDAWARKDSRIRVIHKENGGLSDARNAGLAIAEGEFVSFVDSDDWVDLCFLEILYRTAAEHDCQIVECAYISTSGETPELSQDTSTTVYSAQEAMELHLLDSWFRPVVWNKLYRREVITALFEKGKCHEDVFWTYQIIANCRKLAHVDRHMYFYFQREGSIMGQGYSLKRLDAVEAAMRRCAFVTEKFPALAGIAQGQFIGYCMYHYQLLQANPDVDPDSTHRKWVHRQAGQVGAQWKNRTNFALKQRIWLGLFFCSPKIISRIRNNARIGL